MQYLNPYDSIMTLSKKYTCFFAFGVGCIALGYSLWMYLLSNASGQYPIALAPTIFAPLSAVAVAAGCWHWVVERMQCCKWAVGALIGAVSGWSIFASGLLVTFTLGVAVSSDKIQTVDELLSLLNVVFAAGPLFLFILWGWIPVLICVLLGVLLLRFRCAQFPKKPEK